MQLVSFIMSIVMAVCSLVSPLASIGSSNSEAQAKVDKFFSIIMPEDGDTINSETREILVEILSDIVIEGIDGQGENLEESVQKIPVFEEGERDTARLDVYASPLKKAFGDIMSKAIEKQDMDLHLKQFLMLVVNGVYDMYIYFQPTEKEGVYAFCYDCVDNNGTVVEIKTLVRYDKNTGEIYSVDNNGILGSGYDFNVKTYTVTTPVDVWMRNAGYTVLFDIVGNMGFINCDTARIKFEYGGKYWMFQLWKGNYAFDLLNGGEIGIYNKTDKNSIMYDCASDDEMLNMSLKVLHGDETVIDMERQLHWWLCGMRFGKTISPDELTLCATVEFDDLQMMNCFVEAAEEQYFDEITVSVSGNAVSLIWN